MHPLMIIPVLHEIAPFPNMFVALRALEGVRATFHV
jgi:hypothetical protein